MNRIPLLALTALLQAPQAGFSCRLRRLVSPRFIACLIAVLVIQTATLWPIGRPLSGLQVYENQRAVDYLLARPEVDGSRLGVTGASGRRIHRCSFRRGGGHCPETEVSPVAAFRILHLLRSTQHDAYYYDMPVSDRGWCDVQ